MTNNTFNQQVERDSATHSTSSGGATLESPPPSETKKNRRRVSLKDFLLYGLALAIGKWLGNALGFGMLVIVIGVPVVFFLGALLSKHFLAGSTTKFRLIRVMLWSNLVAWCVPIVGLVVAGATLELSRRQENQRRFRIFGHICLVLSVINFVTGTLIELSDTYTKAAEKLLKEGKYEDAIQTANEAISKNIWIWGASSAHYVRGRAEVALKRYDAALTDFQQCNDPFPDDYGVFKDRALLLYSCGKYAQADNDIETYIQNSPEDNQGYALRAAINFKLNRNAEASADLRKARELGFQPNSQYQ